MCKSSSDGCGGRGASATRMFCNGELVVSLDLLRQVEPRLLRLIFVSLDDGTNDARCALYPDLPYLLIIMSTRHSQPRSYYRSMPNEQFMSRLYAPVIKLFCVQCMIHSYHNTQTCVIGS